MKFVSITSIFYVTFQIAAFADLLVFENNVKWLEDLGGEWSLNYFSDPTTDSIASKKIVEASKTGYLFDLNNKNIKSVMLYHDKNYVCDLTKDLNNFWRVPTLSIITFDARQARLLGRDQWLNFSSEGDHNNGFFLGLPEKKTAKRVLPVGQILKVRIASPKEIFSVGDIIVANSVKGNIKVIGNVKDKWTLNMFWQMIPIAKKEL